MIVLVKRTINICITIILTLGIALLGVFVFSKSWLRLFESLGDLITSIGYYFSKLLGLRNGVFPRVKLFSSVFTWNGFLPDSSVKARRYIQEFFRLFVDKENFVLWLNGIVDILSIIIIVVALGGPWILLLGILLQRLQGKQNNDYNKDTIFLRAYKKVVSVAISPTIKFIREYIDFIRNYRWIIITWGIATIITLNLGSIVVGVLAYYFYFAISFDVLNLWVQLSKLIIDLQVVIKTVPLWVWLIIGYFVFDVWRKKKAIERLQYMEAQNCGFIKELPIVSMTNGTMGKKKTTMITDMALSQEVMFRQKAFEILQKNDVKFPRFPWICFELELRACMEHKVVYNLATAKKFVDKKRERFNKSGNAKHQLYGYDIEKYGRTYNNGLYESDLFDVLETYAKAYFIYVIESSLIVANYSIREDNSLIDAGNFPMWALNFFPEVYRKNDRHAHILDFDALRLGRKIIEDNINTGSFEFGVIVITEIGKERGNNLELKELKKGAEETNQKNDLFNTWLKMCRHAATVDNFPFIKVLTDEQRPESWGADARDLCDIIKILDSGELKVALPCYTIEEMVAEIIFNKFIKVYYDHRFRRGDNTLLMYLFKGIATYLFNRNVITYNKYGFFVLKVEKENGTQTGRKKKKRYYIMSMKTYRKRFITDCFGDYFNELSKKSKVGIMDYEEYETEKASVEELKLQNSYFINSLYKDSNAN